MISYSETRLAYHHESAGHSNQVVSQNMTLFHTKNPVYGWTMQFKEFKASYGGSYEYCLIHPEEKEELIHFLYYHRWIGAKYLKRFFGETLVDNVIAMPRRCFPSAFKIFKCKCHSNRNV